MRLFYSIALLFLWSLGVSAELIHQDLQVQLDPPSGRLQVSDTLRFPPGQKAWTFRLHPNLVPEIQGAGRLEQLGGTDRWRHYRLYSEGNPITLVYGGVLRGRFSPVRESLGRVHRSTRGMIRSEGVFLTGASGWYPQDDSSRYRFRLRVQVPEGWIAVSQGAGPERQGDRWVWQTDLPQEAIYLVAAPFSLFRQSTPFGEAQAYLRSPEAALAQPYLDATGNYLQLYSALIAPYPYEKFALVENFWETGYGMPSFTLLGPRVLRLPFLLHSAYPHEILHNWWGNGVYVDEAQGNWSEGLTAYLADHLHRESCGRGAEYRRDQLQAYADFVTEKTDFPIQDFRSRQHAASQAIGYGKTLMMLHMLRRQLGDAVFLDGLRRFYGKHRFQAADFQDLRKAFEQASGRDLQPFFQQWTARTGAPALALTQVRLEKKENGYRVRGRILQTQEAPPFSLRVPLVIHLQGGAVREQQIFMPGRAQDFSIDLPAFPLRLALDPGFDLFRALAPGETPVRFSALFGAEQGLMVLPAASEIDYTSLAKAWIGDLPGWALVRADEIETLPQDRPIWLLGWENPFLPLLAQGEPAIQFQGSEKKVQTPVGLFSGAEQSLALVSRWRGQPIGFLGVAQAEALPGLARKLPHYGRYSLAIFQGTAPTNRLKSSWPVGLSDLSFWFIQPLDPALSSLPKPPFTALLDPALQKKLPEILGCH